MTPHDACYRGFAVDDNSTYEISREQLDFVREAVRDGTPSIVVVHIPLYTPGRPMGYGCGHPRWSAATDRNYRIEQRPRWPETGPSESTFAFHRDVFSAPNVIAIFAGHTHLATVDVLNRTPQFVTPANAHGEYLDVTVEPTSE